MEVSLYIYGSQSRRDTCSDTGLLVDTVNA